MSKQSELVEQVRAFVAGLHEKREELRVEREALEQERAGLLAAPVSRDDAIAFVSDYLDQRAARFEETCGWGDLLDRVRHPRDAATGHEGKGLSLAEIEASLSMDRFANANRFGEHGISFLSRGLDPRSFVASFDDMALYLFGDIIKQRIRAFVESKMPELPASEAARVGPPVAERRKRLETIAERLAAIAEEDADVSAQLKELNPPAPRGAHGAELDAQPEVRRVPEEAINQYQSRLNQANCEAVARAFGFSPDEIRAAFNERQRLALENRFSHAGPVRRS